MANQLVTKAEGQELTLERVFNAPRELVFQAFTQSEHLKHWWGPRGWEITVSDMDFRPGGSWHYCFKCMDQAQGDFYGMESWGKAVYDQIETPARIVYVDYFSDAEGTLSEDMPPSHIVMTFETLEGGKTKVVNHATYASPEALRSVLDMGMEQGIGETYDRLDEYLEQAQA
ncbi:SRPBCC domain-containing protein [Paenibacillus xanthanilyticus]|uniref:SRPBCC domain-containing protein n=1 Tax=Paenibacillus xanthanilyticus TaxID=1783531 RepID=A0ABV8JUS1_9BACL